MKKSLLVLLFVTVLSYGMEDKSLDLVVGSNRKSNAIDCFPAHTLWQEGNADLTHTKTYGGNATTMDLKKTTIPGAKHIVGDASCYKFGEGTFGRLT